MIPLWIVSVIVILALLVVYLYWRLRQCKCGLMEGFETAQEGKEAETVETEETEETDKADDVEKEATDTDGKEAETVDTSDIEPSQKAKDTKKEKKDAKDAKDNKDATALKDTKPETGAAAATTAAAKKLSDQFMNYGEMKIFNSLRDNAYSLNDIKRMIREGEINEKMIEKFLARVEAMEDGSGAAPLASKATATKSSKPVIEGFSPSGYASAMFA